MALRTTVIVNGINNLSDARYCAGMGVDIIGFNLIDNHPERISADTLKEISGWVAGVALAGEFETTSTEVINQQVEAFHLSYVQLDTLSPVEEIQKITAPVIQKVFLNQDTVAGELVELMQRYQPYVKYFLIYSADLTTIDASTAAFLSSLSAQFPVLIGFGLEKDHVNEVLNTIKPGGIGLQGGQEIKPGLKDFDELQEIFEEIEEI